MPTALPYPPLASRAQPGAHLHGSTLAGPQRSVLGRQAHVAVLLGEEESAPPRVPHHRPVHLVRVRFALPENGRHKGAEHWRAPHGARLTLHAHPHCRFDRVMTALIMANCLLLACYDPLDYDNSGARNRAINNSELVFLALFTAEMVVKIVALDVWGKPSGYFNDGWNW